MIKKCGFCRKDFSDRSRMDIRCCSLKCRRDHFNILIPNTKECEVCGIVFTKPKGIRGKTWKERKLCSVACRTKLIKENKIGFTKGHPEYSTKGRFNKGHTTWNKNVFGRQPWQNIKGLVRYPKGPSHPNWNGGISTLYENIKTTPEYRLWRNKIFTRDKFTCQHCGQVGGTIHADHIKPFSHIIKEENITDVDKAKKCSKLWDVFNGRTLCIGCHKKTPTYGYKAINLIKKIVS